MIRLYYIESESPRILLSHRRKISNKYCPDILPVHTHYFPVQVSTIISFHPALLQALNSLVQLFLLLNTGIRQLMKTCRFFNFKNIIFSSAPPGKKLIRFSCNRFNSFSPLFRPDGHYLKPEAKWCPLSPGIFYTPTTT